MGVICTSLQHEGAPLQHAPVNGWEESTIPWPPLRVQTSVRDNILTFKFHVLSILTEICGAHQHDLPETFMILHTVRIALSLQSKKKTGRYPPTPETICHCVLTPVLGSSRTSSLALFTPTDRPTIEMLYKSSPLTLTSVNCTFSNRQHEDLDGCNREVVRLVEDRHSREGYRSRLEYL